MRVREKRRVRPLASRGRRDNRFLKEDVRRTQILRTRDPREHFPGLTDRPRSFHRGSFLVGIQKIVLIRRRRQEASRPRRERDLNGRREKGAGSSGPRGFRKPVGRNRNAGRFGNGGLGQASLRRRPVRMNLRSGAGMSLRLRAFQGCSLREKPFSIRGRVRIPRRNKRIRGNPSRRDVRNALPVLGGDDLPRVRSRKSLIRHFRGFGETRHNPIPLEKRRPVNKDALPERFRQPVSKVRQDCRRRLLRSVIPVAVPVRTYLAFFENPLAYHRFENVMEGFSRLITHFVVVGVGKGLV